MTSGNGNTDTTNIRWDFYVTTKAPGHIEPDTLLGGIRRGLHEAGAGDVYIEVIEDTDDEDIFNNMLQSIENIRES